MYEREAYDLEVALHNIPGPVATEASLHLSVKTRIAAMLEYCWGAVPWRADLVRGSERVGDGHLLLSPALGLGSSGTPRQPEHITPVPSAALSPVRRSPAPCGA